MSNQQWLDNDEERKLLFSLNFWKILARLLGLNLKKNYFPKG
jgi:hypothetical protein